MVFIIKIAPTIVIHRKVNYQVVVFVVVIFVHMVIIIHPLIILFVVIIV